MGRMYSAVFEGVSVSAAQDLFELLAGAAVVVAVHEVHITNDSDEVSQQLPFAVKRIPATVTSGSGGAAVTPRKLGGVQDPAATSTVERNNTSRASSTGTIEVIRRAGENVLNGYHLIFPPEQRVIVPPGGTIVVGLEAAPSGAIPLSGEIIFEEIG